MEFYTESAGGTKAIPDSDQAARLKQAIARMERFRALTGIPYDRFMIFPHEKYPAVTLKFMKRYNYLAMANAVILPLGEPRPRDPIFYLTPTTSLYENFPGVRRYSVEGPVPENLIAVHAFLEHPLLFYAHHGFFAAGATAFNATADLVNRLDPSIFWGGLADMARHLYRIRIRADQNLDVSTPTADFILSNKSGHAVTYHVTKDENFAEHIAQATANGQSVSYSREDGQLKLVLTVPAGEERHVVIEYANDLNITSTDVSRPNWRINALRRISDFRDLTLSRLPLGDKLVAFYYRNLGKRGWDLCKIVLAVLVAGGVVIGMRIVRWLIRRRRTAALLSIRIVPTSPLGSRDERLDPPTCSGNFKV
jgi:hypothetical protein